MTRLSMLGLVALLLLPLTATAAPSADLWERWTAHDATATAQVDHAAWDGFLARHLRTGEDDIARIAYDAVSDSDKGELAAYLAALAGTRVSGLNRAEQQAYWINLYNALTVQVILDHYPVDSIRDIDISPGFFSAGPWGKKLIAIEGETVSLDDIEHRILRPIWKDPRIHYAVNCASIGCPNLQDKAFTADNTEALLNRGARAYINHPRGVRVDGNKLTVSSIYKWFEADFGGTDAGVIAHLQSFAEPDLKAALSRVKRIDADRYNWSLNR